MFADTSSASFKKTQFLYLREGDPKLVVLLDENAPHFYMHTIATSDHKYPKVPHTPGKCVVCDNATNENHKRYRRIYRTNVLDVTPVKVCPSCGMEYNLLKGVPETCLKDGADLSKVTVTNVNEVKLLESGVKLFSAVNSAIQSATMSGDIEDPQDAVWLFLTSGKRLDKITSISVYKKMDTPPQDQLDSYETFDVADFVTYEDDEVIALMTGTPLATIWERRKSSSQDNDSEEAVDFEDSDFDFELPGL